MPTAFQIAQGRQAPLSMGLFMAVRKALPLLSGFDARTSSDDKFYTLAVVSLPASSFIGIGEGLTASEGNLELREFSCAGIGGLVKAEVDSAAKWDKRHTQSGYTWFDLQTELRVTADLKNIEKQMIQGTANDLKGFPGAKEMTPFVSGNVLAMTDSSQAGGFVKSVVNVGGSAANTASSVYSFVFGELESQLVLGNDIGSEIIRIGETIRQMLAPVSSEPSKLSMHDLAEARGCVGLAVNGWNSQVPGQTAPVQYSVRRACNITNQVGYTLTDTVMDKLVRSHGGGRSPGLFAMSQRSGEQLAASRTPTAVTVLMGLTGANAADASFNIKPPPPDNWKGVSIAYPDEAIVDTDAIES